MWLIPPRGCRPPCGRGSVGLSLPTEATVAPATSVAPVAPATSVAPAAPATPVAPAATPA